jgi:hypothetical protein
MFKRAMKERKKANLCNMWIENLRVLYFFRDYLLRLDNTFPADDNMYADKGKNILCR